MKTEWINEFVKNKYERAGWLNEELIPIINEYNYDAQYGQTGKNEYLNEIEFSG